MPNYYVSNNGYFQTGINFSSETGIGLWSHLLTNRSYQVFYGHLQPFIIESVTKEQLITKFLTSIEYQQDALRYQNEFDYHILPITFNKCAISADNINSGELTLIPQLTNNLSQTLQYPKFLANNTEILVTLTEGTWQFNGFTNIVRDGNQLPIWLNDCNNMFKDLNPVALNYQMPTFQRNRLRANYFRVLLANTKYSQYKFLFKWLTNKAGKSTT